MPLPKPDRETTAAADRVKYRKHCRCLQGRNKKRNLLVHSLHSTEQDESSQGWLQTLDLIASTKNSNSEALEPAAEIAWDDWVGVTTLPREIGTLNSVRALRLYGSHLQRLPPEIGQMSALENLDVYTSYSLHWLPYEVLRCKRLIESRISTRALYGNVKSRFPFPPLRAPERCLLPNTCSVCDRGFGERDAALYWVTLEVATDIVPLLVHSCSDDCTKSIPTPPQGYFERPHKGGDGVGMPSF